MDLDYEKTKNNYRNILLKEPLFNEIDEENAVRISKNILKGLDDNISEYEWNVLAEYHQNAKWEAADDERYTDTEWHKIRAEQIRKMLEEKE